MITKSQLYSNALFVRCQDVSQKKLKKLETDSRDRKFIFEKLILLFLFKFYLFLFNISISIDIYAKIEDRSILKNDSNIERSSVFIEY